MKKTLIALAVAALLAGCAPTMSTLKNGDQVTDFKASVDANARIQADTADVHYKQQEVVAACFANATTDTRIVACAMMGQSTNMSQHTAGRPTLNRVPDSGAESNQKTAGQALGVVKSVGTAAVVGAAVGKVAESVSGVQAKDPVVTPAPEVVIVRPEIVRP